MKDMDESQRGPVNSTTVVRVKSTWLKQVYWLAVRCVCVSVSVCVCVYVLMTTKWHCISMSLTDIDWSYTRVPGRAIM